MIFFATLGCWWGGATMRDSMLTSFSFVQIGEFSFIIASLGTSLGVLHPAIYPIIVASSVVTTFLTPYIMKAAVPCYNFLYNHGSPCGPPHRRHQAPRESVDQEHERARRGCTPRHLMCCLGIFYIISEPPPSPDGSPHPSNRPTRQTTPSPCGSLVLLYLHRT